MNLSVLRSLSHMCSYSPYPCGILRDHSEEASDDQDSVEAFRAHDFEQLDLAGKCNPETTIEVALNPALQALH